VDAFPLVRAIWEQITGEPSPYRSPTDMGVNRCGFGIVDDAVVRQAAGQEIIRRYFRYACEYAMGLADRETVPRVEGLLQELGLQPEDRAVVLPARRAAAEAAQTGKGNAGIYCGAAIGLKDGALVAGKNSPFMHAASAAVLNAIKQLAHIPDALHLLPPSIMQSIAMLKREVLDRKAENLSLQEALIALSISSTMNPLAQAAMDHLKELRGCEMHLTHIPTPGDEAGLRHLGLNVTSDPQFATRNLYVM
jgi:uncharacterized protein (UPF0371 family)